MHKRVLGEREKTEHALHIAVVVSTLRARGWPAGGPQLGFALRDSHEVCAGPANRSREGVQIRLQGMELIDVRPHFDPQNLEARESVPGRIKEVLPLPL
eukprot:14437360-Alexandrium_andersonii.AAC.1